MNIKFPKKKSKKFIENFFIKKGLKSLVKLSKEKHPSVNQKTAAKPMPPELNDLYNLYSNFHYYDIYHQFLPLSSVQLFQIEE